MELYRNTGSIKETVVDVVDYDKDTVCRYLESFPNVALCARRALDCMTGKEIADGFCVKTDGEYEWCDFLPYHIKKYNIGLPKEFVEKCANLH